ncbi:MAG: hypothetical protein QOH73_1300 [Gaiellaceae bacterium]|nr:hypothetical protein [Gaiellaceae bacterium]
MRTRSAMLALLVVLLVAAAGCGGSKKKTSSPAPAATHAATTTKGSSTNKGGTKSLANCPELAKLGAQYQAALTAANASAKGDPAKQAENAGALFDKFADSAPEEIRADFKVFGKILKSYAVVMAKAHYKPGKVPTAAQIAALTQASKAFAGPELQAASAHIQAWSQTHCGGAFGK